MKRKFILRKFGKLVTLGLAAIAVSVMFGWMAQYIFTIRSVEVIGDNIDIAVNLKTLPNNLLFFPTRQIEDALKREYPLIASVHIRKKFPSTIVITVERRKPFVLVGTQNDLYSLDEQGVVIRQYPDETDLPRVTIPVRALMPGSRVLDPAVQTAVGFIRESADFLTIREVRMYDTIALVADAGRMRIMFRANADVSVLVRTLQTMISGFRIKGKLPSSIDVRFDKPVVVF